MKRSRFEDNIGSVFIVYIGVGLLWTMLSAFYLAHLHPFLVPFHPALIVLLFHSLLSIIGSALLFFLLLRRFSRRGSERFFRALFDGNRDAVMIADTGTGIIVDANRQAEQLLERPRGELIGMDRIHLHPPEEREKYQRQFADHVRDGGARPVEAEIITRGGRRIPIEISASVIELPDRRLIQGVFKDITERKQSEAQLRAYSENLEQMVAMRTRELDEVRADLFASAKLAAMGRLGAGIAHQLNGPLGGGMLLIDALIEECKGMQKPLRMLGETRKALEQMHDIVECMLSLASVRRRGRPARMDVDVGEILEGILSILLLECSRRGVLIEKQRAADLPRIRANVGDLDQVFLNLINNAVEAMEGGGTLSVRTASIGGGVEVRIADSGRGILPAHLDHIFEPFFTTRRDRKGIGLGLSISREIVDRYAGRISVTSERGRGSEFTVWLPPAGLSDDGEEPPQGEGLG